jgi:threonine dehydrogenase-like Zn-dependent dehydrogenase
MWAVVLRSGQLAVKEIADPSPAPGQILLETLATAICASDVHYMDNPEIVGSDATGLFGYDADRDTVLGHEFVGRVIGLGEGVSPEMFPLGSRVTSIPFLVTEGGGHIIGSHPDAPGSFAEKLLVSQDLARVVPGDVADEAVALVDAFAVGEGYVRLARMDPGDVPLVIGAGAIGLSTIAALVREGRSPVVVSDFSEERRRIALEFGAHIVVDPSEDSPFRVLDRQARGGRQQVIFECAGSAGLIDSLIGGCSQGSLIVCAGGWYTGDTVSVTSATRKGVTVQFGGSPEFRDWYGTLASVCEGRLDPLPSVGLTIGLDDVPAAMEMARRGEGPPRIIIRPSPLTR